MQGARLDSRDFLIEAALGNAMDYLPKDATIEQACDWLKAKTGTTWILPRLLECHLTPYFWLEYNPAYPPVFGGKIEGFQTKMMFHGDLCRLESDGGYALVNMFAAHDGKLIKVEPAARVPLSDLRFKREQVERVAEIFNNTEQTETPAPVVPVAPSKRRTWWDISSPYMVDVLRAGQYATAKELYNALEAKAGTNSPFDIGTGTNRYSLFIRELAKPITLKTIQNNWQKLRAAAKELR